MDYGASRSIRDRLRFYRAFMKLSIYLRGLSGPNKLF